MHLLHCLVFDSEKSFSCLPGSRWFPLLHMQNTDQCTEARKLAYVTLGRKNSGDFSNQSALPPASSHNCNVTLAEIKADMMFAVIDQFWRCCSMFWKLVSTILKHSDDEPFTTPLLQLSPFNRNTPTYFLSLLLVFSVQLMSLKLNTSCESFKLKPNEKGLLVWDVCRRWWVKTSQLEATQKYKVKAAEWIRRDSVVVLQRFNLYIYNSWKRRIQEK